MPEPTFGHLPPRDLTAQELVDILRLKDGHEAADAFLAELPEGFDMSTVVATVPNHVTLRCNVCQRCQEMDINAAEWSPGMVHPRPEGWASFESVGQGYQDGVFDVCADCVVMAHIIVHCTGGEVDHDLIAEWKAHR